VPLLLNVPRRDPVAQLGLRILFDQLVKFRKKVDRPLIAESPRFSL
jgi:hypothetical protein